MLSAIFTVLRILSPVQEDTPEEPPEPEIPSFSQRCLTAILRSQGHELSIEVPDPRNGVDAVNAWFRANTIHAHLRAHDRGYYQYALFVGPGTTVLIP